MTFYIRGTEGRTLERPCIPILQRLKKWAIDILLTSDQEGESDSITWSMAAPVMCFIAACFIGMRRLAETVRKTWNLRPSMHFIVSHSTTGGSDGSARGLNCSESRSGKAERQSVDRAGKNRHAGQSRMLANNRILRHVVEHVTICVKKDIMVTLDVVGENFCERKQNVERLVIS